MAVLIASLVFTGYLVRSVSENLRALSVAQHDDVSWNLAQLEVEVLQLQQIAAKTAEDEASSLTGFVRRFDIFYSRVGILSGSQRKDLFTKDVKTTAAIDAFSDFLDRTTPIVDGPRSDLRAALPQILSEITELRPEARAIALSGIQFFAEQDAQRREDLSQTLIKLAIAVMGLVLILVMALLVLERLFRESRLVTQENQRVRSRFEAAISSSLDAVLVVDTAGKIIDYNGAAASVFGYEPEEAIGQDMAELIVPDHMREMHKKGMNRFLETGEKKVIGAGRVRLEAKHKSGDVFPVELSISVSETDGEQVFVSYLRDITAEIKAVDDLRMARDKAREGEKAKSDLLTVMSHEMRTPLNGILGSLSLIDQTGMAARQQQHLKSIAASGELLLSHVNDVLDLSSLSSDARPKEKIRFDLRDVLQSVSDSLLANAQTRGNTLTFNVLSDDLRVVLGYKTALQQCLVNLVGNAIKFTHDGTIAVEVERLSHDDLVEIRVSDTGVGIAPENLERVFEEFVTIDTAFDRENAGTGLGLAITKRLAESMDGSIEADSLLGEGSLFTLKIPLPDAPKVTEEQDSPEPKLHQQIEEGITALVVDDNEINRLVLSDMLKELGVEVAEAADGYAAVDLVAQRAFDVLLLDISMPGIDGIETLTRIRGLDVAWKDVPAIAVTAHAAQKDHDRILQAPFFDLVVKPVKPGILKVKLARATSGLSHGSEATDANSAAPDFKVRFGEERYQKAIKALHQELASLATKVEAAPQLTEEIRQLAHKAAGSSAVLEEDELWTLVAALENATQDDWADAKGQFLKGTAELCEPLG
ncbi:MAG: ATP-binding protein [Pseudomonadota bacterium]